MITRESVTRSKQDLLGQEGKQHRRPNPRITEYGVLSGWIEPIVSTEVSRHNTKSFPGFTKDPGPFQRYPRRPGYKTGVWLPHTT